MTRHTAMFFPRSDFLVVTFDDMHSRRLPSPSYPWAYPYLKQLGVSHLGIMIARRNDWYRHIDLVTFFSDLRTQGFFQHYKQVVFYGSSMGGFGALSYCSAAPGARVVTLSPQTSLDPDVVPFETRYPRGFARGDWTLPGSDAALQAMSASDVIVFADPYQPKDTAHVKRLWPNNLTWFKCHSLGHSPARFLRQGGVLSELTTRALFGQLSQDRMHAATRHVRATVPGVMRKTLRRAADRGHARLALRALDSFSTRFPKHSFRSLQSQLSQESPLQSG